MNTIVAFNFRVIDVKLQLKKKQNFLAARGSSYLPLVERSLRRTIRAEIIVVYLNLFLYLCSRFTSKVWNKAE